MGEIDGTKAQSLFAAIEHNTDTSWPNHEGERSVTDPPTVEPPLIRVRRELGDREALVDTEHLAKVRRTLEMYGKPKSGSTPEERDANREQYDRSNPELKTQNLASSVRSTSKSGIGGIPPTMGETTREGIKEAKDRQNIDRFHRQVTQAIGFVDPEFATDFNLEEANDPEVRRKLYYDQLYSHYSQLPAPVGRPDFLLTQEMVDGFFAGQMEDFDNGEFNPPTDKNVFGNSGRLHNLSTQVHSGITPEEIQILDVLESVRNQTEPDPYYRDIHEQARIALRNLENKNTLRILGMEIPPEKNPFNARRIAADKRRDAFQQKLEILSKSEAGRLTDENYILKLFNRAGNHKSFTELDATRLALFADMEEKGQKLSPTQEALKNRLEMLKETNTLRFLGREIPPQDNFLNTLRQRTDRDNDKKLDQQTEEDKQEKQTGRQFSESFNTEFSAMYPSGEAVSHRLSQLQKHRGFSEQDQRDLDMLTAAKKTSGRYGSGHEAIRERLEELKKENAKTGFLILKLRNFQDTRSDRKNTAPSAPVVTEIEKRMRERPLEPSPPRPEVKVKPAATEEQRLLKAALEQRQKVHAQEIWQSYQSHPDAKTMIAGNLIAKDANGGEFSASNAEFLLALQLNSANLDATDKEVMAALLRLQERSRKRALLREQVLAVVGAIGPDKASLAATSVEKVAVPADLGRVPDSELAMIEAKLLRQLAIISLREVQEV